LVRSSSTNFTPEPGPLVIRLPSATGRPLRLSSPTRFGAAANAAGVTSTGRPEAAQLSAAKPATAATARVSETRITRWKRWARRKAKATTRLHIGWSELPPSWPSQGRIAVTGATIWCRRYGRRHRRDRDGYSRARRAGDRPRRYTPSRPDGSPASLA